MSESDRSDTSRFTDVGRLDASNSESHFEQIFQNAPDAVFLVAADGADKGRIVAANAAAERMHWCEPGELHGKNISELDAPEAAKDVPDRLRRLASGEVLRFEINHLRKDGTEFPVEVTASRLVIDGVPYILAFDRDISERKNAEAERRELQNQLLQSQKLEAVGQLAAGIAHEFNNIIFSIVSNVEFVLSVYKAEVPDHIVPHLEQIDRAGWRASEMTKQLLSLVRKKSTANISIFDLNDLVSNQVGLLRKLLGDGVLVELDLFDSKAWVRADESELENAMLNLCLNARDAVESQGEIRIKTERVELDETEVPTAVQAGQFVRLSVADNGGGISEELLGSIFEPFVTTKPAGQGTGLGLSIVAASIANCHGFVSVESELCEGSVFHIHLPFAKHDVGSPGHRQSHHGLITKGNGETILVCDDDEMVLAAISKLIKAFGYQVISVGSPSQAVEAMAAHSDISLLVTDISMPETDGVQLGLKLKEHAPDLKVICISGYGGQFIESIKDTPFEFVAKPIPAEKLSKIIRDTLDKRSAS